MITRRGPGEPCLIATCQGAKLGGLMIIGLRDCPGSESIPVDPNQDAVIYGLC